ncbi:TPA: hypothetical protein G8355_004026 [Salmonella enterica]|nr:hypothetical protein [Salmonella enterica]HAG4668043.1 hypothetical protein [Salmonella enterica]
MISTASITCAASARTILPLSTTRLILQPDAQYGQTVTTFFIGLAPVNQLAHTRYRAVTMHLLYHVFIVGIA